MAASFKIFSAKDIYESPKSVIFANFDRTCSIGCIQLQVTFGSCYVNPFTRLKPISFSRLSLSLSSTDLVDLSESGNQDSIEKEVLNLKGNNKKNIWKRFRDGDVLKTQTISKTPFRKNNKEQEQDNVPSFCFNGRKIDTSVEYCNSILKQLEQCNDDKTVSFFEWMRSNGKLKDNVTAYNFVLRVLGRKEDWDASEMLIRELITELGSQLNYQVFNTLIYSSYKRVLPKMGTKWFYLMLENGVQPNIATFGMLMSLYQKGGNVEEAEFAFRQMRNLKLICQSAYSAMITIYTRVGFYDKSEEIILLMKEDNVVPNSENWLVQINAYSQQGKLEQAEKMLTSMLEAGVPPNIVAYNTLITGYGKVSNMTSAESIFQNLRSIRLEPDETTYRSMIEGWGRAGHYKEAKWYYQELKKSGYKPNSSNMFTMINLQARHKDEEGTLETLEDMRTMGCQYSSILSSLLQAYEKVERVDKVPLVLRGSFYEHVLVDQTSCSILVMAYVKHHLVDDALRVLSDKQWKDLIFQDNLYHLLICSCKELGLYEEAIKIYSHMPKSDANPNLHITCTMIDIYSIIGRFTEAKDLYLNVSSSGIAFDMVTYSVIVRMFVKAGSLKDACLVLDKMEKQKDIVPDIFLLRDMLRVYQRCGLQEKLADLYFKLLKTEISWDQEMYNCVINCCARALPVDELTRIFDEMLQRGFSPSTITFNVMLDVYGKEKLLKKARKVFWMARKQGLHDVISYNTIIAAYGQSKDFTNMRATVRKMEFSGFSVSLEAYNCMLDAYGKDSQMENFRSVLQRLKESSCVSDHYTYGILINIYGEQGWIEEVAAVLSELKVCGMEPNLCSYNTLIKAYGIGGMVEEAVDVVKEMREKRIEPDHITYINLVHALQRNDNFLEAVKWSLWMKQMGFSNANR
ncbi:hypothetical protein AQUCO_04800025v1 [Aquilegia coerulea]|uniref:Pentacotripeptide-repeat region of PRORP domain-containing protein n=1 Tax=Aquilegia coerulea TaxID=218851 RepID=A0A2G5CKP0_AQUCA|nr:hypothetical protein AQUCO_04800025v1 [Aquilegia coerulea]